MKNIFQNFKCLDEQFQTKIRNNYELIEVGLRKGKTQGIKPYTKRKGNSIVYTLLFEFVLTCIDADGSVCRTTALPPVSANWGREAEAVTPSSLTIPLRVLKQ